MTSIRALKYDARESATWRGHNMSPFQTLHRSPSGAVTRARAHCVNCGMDVDVTITPAANDIDIAGEAVALTCIS